jgi:2-polyprenyl-3-methyl-5-hydroxy-6-metoxy-1,4-benzoquinol methylase
MTATLPAHSQSFTHVPPLQWEHVSCNLCGQSESHVYHRERLPYFGSDVDFEIVRCDHCGLVYTNPRLSDYNAAYLWGSTESEEEIESHARAKTAVFRRAIDRIKYWQSQNGLEPGGRMLDLGCGTGHFLHAAQAQGFTGCGIEPADVPARYAADRMGVEIMQANLYTADLPEGKFDVITAWDVIEHVSDPKGMLENCYRWLKPGGILALRFPSSTWQKIKGVILHEILSSPRPSFAPTIHLYFFNEKTISRLCEETGLKMLEIKTTLAETNSDSRLVDSIKVISHGLVRCLESACRRRLGNLDVFCQKR